MTFSQAIEKAKSGSKIARASWRDQYVALTTGICYRIVDNWVANADDMLAEDWKEVK